MIWLYQMVSTKYCFTFRSHSIWCNISSMINFHFHWVCILYIVCSLRKWSTIQWCKDILNFFEKVNDKLCDIGGSLQYGFHHQKCIRPYNNPKDVQYADRHFNGWAHTSMLTIEETNGAISEVLSLQSLLKLTGALILHIKKISSLVDRNANLGKISHNLCVEPHEIQKSGSN